MSADKDLAQIVYEAIRYNVPVDLMDDERLDAYAKIWANAASDAVLAAGFVKVTDHEPTVRVVTSALEKADETQWSVPRLLAKVAIRALMRGAS